MTFEEWVNNESKLDSRDDPASALREAWNAALDEAVKVLGSPSSYSVTEEIYADRIKELKQ